MPKVSSKFGKFFSVTAVTLVLFALALPCFAKDPGGNQKFDVDLTKMSSTVVYAMVYQMVTEPIKFKGKHIKMKGIFSSYYDDEVERRFFGCVIQDALACCSQGLAFDLAKPRKYPKEYPEEGNPIIITGDFDYEKDEGGGGFPIIRNAEILNK